MTESVVVVDMGNSSVKVGWAGDDVPSAIFPSTISQFNHRHSESVEAHDTHAHDGPHGHESIHPIHRGQVRDWEKLEELWSATFNEVGASGELSIMLAESPRCTPADRAKLAEILFEKFKVPSICMGNSASLSIFASGRTSGVAVEMGAGLTCSVPVYEGLALAHAAVFMEQGGQDVSASLRRLLAEKGVNIDMSVARYLKERMAFVTPTDTRSSSSSSASAAQELRTFGLPDGSEVTVENDVFSHCTQMLFKPERTTYTGVGAQTYESISLCDESIRRDLSHHIIISGGNSMLPGIGDRLGWEVNTRIAQHCDSRGVARYEGRVLPSSSNREPGYTHQRKVAAWIGGSIIGSMDTYRDMKLTKQEFDEGKETGTVVHAKAF